jgi:hypothetical protein
VHAVTGTATGGTVHVAVTRRLSQIEYDSQTNFEPKPSLQEYVDWYVRSLFWGNLYTSPSLRFTSRLRTYSKMGFAGLTSGYGGEAEAVGLLGALILNANTSCLPKGSLAVKRMVLTLHTPLCGSECRCRPLDARINWTSTCRSERHLSQRNSSSVFSHHSSSILLYLKTPQVRRALQRGRHRTLVPRSTPSQRAPGCPLGIWQRRRLFFPTK